MRTNNKAAVVGCSVLVLICLPGFGGAVSRFGCASVLRFQADPFVSIGEMLNELPSSEIPDLVLPLERRAVRNDSFNAGVC